MQRLKGQNIKEIAIEIHSKLWVQYTVQRGTNVLPEKLVFLKKIKILLN